MGILKIKSIHLLTVLREEAFERVTHNFLINYIFICYMKGIFWKFKMHVESLLH